MDQPGRVDHNHSALAWMSLGHIPPVRPVYLEFGSYLKTYQTPPNWEADKSLLHS